MIFLVETPSFFEIPKENLSPSELSEDNQRHLKALRPEKGELISFLNLRGASLVYEIVDIKPVTLSFLRKENKTLDSPRVHLFLAPPSDSALEQAVEQATEVGYAHFHFLRSEHVQLPKGKSLPFSRLKRIIQASCKQCARFWAPELDENLYTLKEAFDDSKQMLRIVADEATATTVWGSIDLSKNMKASYEDVAVFVGPEGGWSESERALLKGEAMAFSLGPNILRVPTAVVSAYMLLLKELK